MFNLKSMVRFGGVTLFLFLQMLANGDEDMSQMNISEVVERTHALIEKNFLDSHGVVLDYVGETPTPQDCEEGRPNSIGWWSPIENGPMLTGIYLVATCERARRSGSQVDKAYASRLARGLIKCASVSDVPGFIVRGIASDGKSHYPLGSTDQTHPWFLGLSYYLKSGLPSLEERAAIVAKMLEVGNVLQANGWKCPCDGNFKKQHAGDFVGPLHRDAVRYVSMLRALYEASGEHVWLGRYRSALAEKPRKSEMTRQEICAAGYEIDRKKFKNQDLESWAMWIYVGAQASLSMLVQNESDPELRAGYAKALVANAKSALAAVAHSERFDNNDSKLFGEANWREVFITWYPQKDWPEAEKLAKIDLHRNGGRKDYEYRYMCQPLAAAAIVAYAGDGFGRVAVEKAIKHYDYARLKLSRFLYSECAYYALPELK